MNSQNKHHPVNAVCLFFSCCLAFMYILPLIGVVHAQTIDEARVAYAQGRFIEAARIGGSLGTSQGFALSAKSLSVHAHYIAKKGKKKKLLEHAIRLARKAILSDPDNADAHLQLARAIGRYAQTTGKFKAAGQAEKIRESTENALRINPKLASAHLQPGAVAFGIGWRNGFVHGPHRLRCAEKGCHCLLRKGSCSGSPCESCAPGIRTRLAGAG